MLPDLLSALPTLHTARLRLRPLTAADVPALYAIFADTTVMRYWSSPPLADEAAAAVLFTEIEANRLSGRRQQWGIARATDDYLIGTCSLGNFDQQNRRAELGYILGQAHWGHGLMHEAQVALLDFAFASPPAGLGLHRLEADIDPRNDASRRSLLRLGFQLEGYLRERWLVAGEVCDSEVFGLLAREWQEKLRMTDSFTEKNIGNK